MDPFHERLARTGLAAAQRYGFALAGGYAVQAAGLLERPSEDIDLFTGWNRRDEFGTAVAAVVQAYRDDGLTVDVERRYDTFARLTVTDGSQTSKVELGVDWRANEPILMAVGPRVAALRRTWTLTTARSQMVPGMRGWPSTRTWFAASTSTRWSPAGTAAPTPPRQLTARMRTSVPGQPGEEAVDAHEMRPVRTIG